MNHAVQFTSSTVVDIDTRDTSLVARERDLTARLDREGDTPALRAAFDEVDRERRHLVRLRESAARAEEAKAARLKAAEEQREAEARAAKANAVTHATRTYKCLNCNEPITMVMRGGTPSHALPCARCGLGAPPPPPPPPPPRPGSPPLTLDDRLATPWAGWQRIVNMTPVLEVTRGLQYRAGALPRADIDALRRRGLPTASETLLTAQPGDRIVARTPDLEGFTAAHAVVIAKDQESPPSPPRWPAGMFPAKH